MSVSVETEDEQSFPEEEEEKINIGVNQLNDKCKRLESCI